MQAQRVVNSHAPIRICDNGGWTDTWFARHGKVFNIAVSPYAEVQIEVFSVRDRDERIVIHAENYGQRYALPPQQQGWLAHPLLEAAVQRMGVPAHLAVEITVFCEAPTGASTGTSAAVAVALVGALECLNGNRPSPHEAAYTAHAIEVEMLGRQSGIQDQLCSAYGGINFIEIADYPRAVVSPIQVPDATWWDLERHLALIYLGKSHDSSQVHQSVIAELESAGPDCLPLDELRRAAEQSRDAICAGDLAALGRAMVENTEAQGRLHPYLVGAGARRVIDIARAHGALGWKVNGAGGDGGSLTILSSGPAQQKRAMIRDIEQESPSFTSIRISLSRHGLRVWEHGP